MASDGTGQDDGVHESYSIRAEGRRNEMRIPIIRVRDKVSGDVHILGTDQHDDLILDKGGLSYYNLQNGDGTLDGYEFVAKKYEDAPYDIVVEWISIEELQKRMKEDPDNYLSVHEWNQLHSEEAKQKRERLKAMVAELWKREKESGRPKPNPFEN